MHREQRGHQRASARRSGHAPQHAEKQDDVQRVQDQADEMVRPGVHPEQPHVHHVRQPRQRMPVRRVSGGEGPGHRGPRQPGGHVRIVGDIDRIVQRHEREMPNGRVGDESNGDEGYASENNRAGSFHSGFPAPRPDSAQLLLRLDERQVALQQLHERAIAL